MHKIFLILNLIILFYSVSFSQGLINNGGYIYIASGKYIVINGNYNNETNVTDGTVTLDGTISLTGDLYNNNTIVPLFDLSSAAGKFYFNGTGIQYIRGTSTANPIVKFKDFEIDNIANNLTIVKDISVTGTLTLTNGCLITSDRTLILTETASFSPAGGSATSFVDGNIRKTGNAALFSFPVGDIKLAVKYWAPVDIAAWNNTNDFTVSYTYSHIFDSLVIPTWQDGASMGPGIDHTSGMEFWIFDRTGGGVQTPNVTLYWKDAVKSDIACDVPGACTDYAAGALADLTLAHWNTGTSKWDNMGGVAAGVYPAGSITNSVAFTGYSPLSFGSKTGINPLPISLLSFVAACSENIITLKWTTLSETNNDYFTLEKSYDGTNWDILAFINGAGNSNSQNDYAYIDINGKEQNYYRLKQTDFDGKFSYSEVIAAKCNSIEPDEDFSNLVIFDNPKDNNIKINFNGGKQGDSYQVQLVDQLGRKLFIDKYIKSDDMNEIISISKNNLASGIYNVILSNNRSVKVKQIVLINH